MTVPDQRPIALQRIDGRKEMEFKDDPYNRDTMYPATSAPITVQKTLLPDTMYVTAPPTRAPTMKRFCFRSESGNCFPSGFSELSPPSMFNPVGKITYL
jgi:hypothetical protein